MVKSGSVRTVDDPVRDNDDLDLAVWQGASGGRRSLPDKVRFKCLPGCGLCCSYRVRVNAAEADAIAAATGGKPFLRDEHYLLKQEGSCVFLDGGRSCSIYPHRPSQCRTYPFYFLEGQVDVDLSCPGVGKGDPVLLSEWEPDPGFRKASGPDALAIGIDPQLAVSLTAGLADDKEFVNPGCAAAVQEFLRIQDGRASLVQGERVQVLKFEVREGRVELGGSVYRVDDVRPLLPTGDEVRRYQQVWANREVFHRFVKLFAPLCFVSPEVLAKALLYGIGSLLPVLAGVMKLHWGAAIADSNCWEAAIRAVDGRLRDKCSRVGIAVFSSGRVS